MQHAGHVKKDIFVEVLEKIQSLTPSQQKLIKESLTHPEKVSTTSKKKLLKKSFGIWAGKKDIKESIEYVDEIRKKWSARLERIKA